MRELRVPGLVERDDVADGGNAGNTGAEVRPDVDVAALEAQPRFFGAEARRHRTAAGGDEQVLGLERERLAVGGLGLDLHRRLAGLRARDPGAGQDLDALLLERALELGRHGVILDRHQPRQQLDDRHLAAEAAEDRGELDADRAAAENDDRPGYVLEVNRFVARDDAGPVDFDAGHAARL